MVTDAKFCFDCGSEDLRKDRNHFHCNDCGAIYYPNLEIFFRES